MTVAREGSLEAPTRHPLDWQSPDFYDEAKLDAELRRVFDICHGCRRCFNLCDSFPRLFELVDASPTGELDGVASAGFGGVVEACTLCDMCFMTKCPYVPPHEFNLDFPHLMLRYRAVERKKGKFGRIADRVAETDRNGRLASPVAPLANWASDIANKPMRTALEMVAGIDRQAWLPDFHRRTFLERSREPLALNRSAPAFGRKAVLYATCFVNYNEPAIGEAARRVLAHNGIETETVYPTCCGMPQLERGNLARVADRAHEVANSLLPWIDRGYEVIALIPSCALMLRFEWPLLVPGNDAVARLAKATRDLSEYVVSIARGPGLAPGLQPLAGGIALHLACHARAQNYGPKAAELLGLIPEVDLTTIERCSGHGGAWGAFKGNFATALKVGRPVARQVAKADKAYLVSECPLAGPHIAQGAAIEKAGPVQTAMHPIELFARAYGLTG
jgi:glycerol-3-phosphate dehydrogenase subunit C